MGDERGNGIAGENYAFAVSPYAYRLTIEGLRYVYPPEPLDLRSLGVGGWRRRAPYASQFTVIGGLQNN